MPNSNLQNKIYKLSDKVFNRINKMLNVLNPNTEHDKGVKRAKDLISNREVTYQQMKRLKNYFDNYNGDGNDNEFKLIGGEETRKWVDNELNQDRESIKTLKKVKKDGGFENAFIKPHTKDVDNSNPTNPDAGMVDITKGSTMDNVMNNTQVYKSSNRKKEKAFEAYNKEINSIKYLIEYMCKN